MAKYEYGRITKDLILDTAFSFLDEPRFSTFSMNELAARLSCTKPAIYRHFAGKDALLDAMENRVIEGLAPYLKTMGMGDDAAGKKSFGELIEYFIKKRIKGDILSNSARRYRTKNGYIKVMNDEYRREKNADMQDKRKKKFIEKQNKRKAKMVTKLTRYQ